MRDTKYTINAPRSAYPLTAMRIDDKGHLQLRFAERQLPSWVVEFAKAARLVVQDDDETGQRAFRGGRFISLVRNTVRDHRRHLENVPKYHPNENRGGRR